MQVKIDLDKDIVIIPNNFFQKVSEDNEKLKKFGAQPQSAVDRIKRSFAVAMADTDNRLLTNDNAKLSSISKLSIDEEIVEKVSKLDREAATIKDNG